MPISIWKTTSVSGTTWSNTEWTTFTVARPPLTPFEHNCLLQLWGYPLGIPWDRIHMSTLSCLLDYGRVHGIRNSPYPRDYQITTLGREALKLQSSK